MSDLTPYERRIREFLKRAGKSTVAKNNDNLGAGRELLKAREEGNDLEFEQLLARLGVEKTRSDRLRLIAGNPNIAADWQLLERVDGETVLYVYATLQENDFKEAIKYTQEVGPENVSHSKLEKFHTTRKTRESKKTAAAAKLSNSNAPELLITIAKLDTFAPTDWRDAEKMAQAWEQRFGAKIRIERMPALLNANTRLDSSVAEGATQISVPEQHPSLRA